MFESQTKDIIYRQSSYEDNIALHHRKDFGIFLTNNINTVDRILDIIDFSSESILDKTILEPSCGNGVFVIRFLERLVKYVDSKDKIFEFIEDNLFFVDIDPKMIQETETNIQKFCEYHFGYKFCGSFNSFVFDYTQRVKTKGNSLFDKPLDTPIAKLLDKIDFVIGNPPYVSLYGRRDRKKNEEQRVYYLNRYSQFPDTLKNGKINYVMLFIEHSIDFLKVGGKLSFIIDLAIFETAYEYTRKYLLENTKILSIRYNIKDFEVTSGQVIIKVQKEKVDNNWVTITDAETESQIKINQAIWYNPSDQYRFRFNICSEDKVIIDKIKIRKCKTLKELYPKKNLRTCVMLLNMEDRFVFPFQDRELKVPIYPYYQGSKGLGGKYANLNHSKYFHYNKELQDFINDKLKEELEKKGVKNKKRLGLGETIIYDNPKIFIRQSAKKIIASYEEKPSAANNSLYVFSLRENSKKAIHFLKFLTGLLNSNLITFYAQQERIIRFSKGKQPQIKISDLYTIPVPMDLELQSSIAKLVTEIYENKNISKYIFDIDKIVYKFFKITEQEIEQIEQSISNF